MTISSQGVFMIKVLKKDLTQSLLKEYLHYCEETGIFTWIKNTHKFRNRVGTVAGSVSKRDGHIEIRFLGSLYRASILAWFYVYGTFPKNHIDHIDHNEQNNAINNLRDVSQRENNMNMPRKRTNTSGVCGVWINKRSTEKPYVAEIMVKGVKIHLGAFKTLAEASEARVEAQKLLGFHENHGK